MESTTNTVDGSPEHDNSPGQVEIASNSQRLGIADDQDRSAEHGHIASSSQNSEDRPTRNGEDGVATGYLTYSQQDEVVRQREGRDDRSYGNFAESFIYRSLISVQITLQCVGRGKVGNQVIVSVRALLSHILSGLQRPLCEHEAWDRDVGGGTLIRHSMAAVWQIAMGMEAAGKRVEAVECRLVDIRVERAFKEVLGLV